MDESQRNPYHAPEARIVDPGQPGEHFLAGRGERLGASLIDTILLLIVLLPLMFLGGYFDQLQNPSAAVADTLLLEAMWLVIGFAAFVVLQGYPLHATAQTWGKRLLGIKIVGVDGRRVSFLRLIALRYLPAHLIGIVPFAGQFLSMANVLLIFRADRRCGHDLIAGTIVVRNMTPAAVAAHDRP